jgi:hypothetical protein
MTVALKPQEMPQLLVDWSNNNKSAPDQLVSLVHEGLRFFGGLSVEETAEVLGVHPNTVIRDWDMAKAWLRRQPTRGAEG